MELKLCQHNKRQQDARPGGRCDMRPSQIIADYITHFKF